MEELKQKLKVCLDEETAYTEKLKVTLQGDQVMSPKSRFELNSLSTRLLL